jgi:ferric-dicitrate binding protein FerR (iron transport regulator)
MSDRLRKLIDEARDDLGAREVRDVDWDSVDRELFARIEQERRLERTRAVGLRTPAWGVGAAVLAAAACFALVAGKTHETRSIEAPAAVLASPAAGDVVGILGSGELLVDGKPAAVGATLHLGDVVETRGTSVTVDRPGKLTMVLEAGTHATVTHVQGALVLALDTGAVEAQVVPVPSGEAFAVDVAGSRVAVHGTHLRVAREVDHVVVDLSEGVVVLGAAPREGSTVGTLVTAPAHADFAALDLRGTLTITHDGAAVRSPIAVAVPLPAAQGMVLAPPAPPPAPRQVGSRAGASPAARPAHVSPATSATPPLATPDSTPDPNAGATLASVVRACVAAHPSVENLTVVVNTTLHLDLDADGNVRAARFEPPVAPDVNTCAAPAIYRTRFAHGGSADVPVDVTMPAAPAAQ